MGRYLVIIGIIIAAIGLLWMGLERFGIRSLPGDITIRRENFVFHFPIVSSIVISIILSVVLTIILRFFNR